MKAALMTLAALVLSLALAANPIMPEVLSELWFNDQGHLMLELCMNFSFNNQTVDLADIHLVNDAMDVAIPQAGAISDYPYVLDVTALLPGFVLNPEVDTLQIYFDNGSEFVGNTWYRWGNCTYSEISAIAPGQSAARVHTMDGHVLAKDEPPTPGTHAYDPVACDTLIIMVTDQFGGPVSGAPVWISLAWVTQSTDENGIFSILLPATCCYVNVRHPQTNEVVYEQSRFLEPHQTTVIPVTISMTANAEEVIPVVKTGLRGYPNPFNSMASDRIGFSYAGDAKLGRESCIRIYDAKGRFLQQIRMSSKGAASWQPPADIGSGHYLARLISNNRIVDTTAITINK